MKKFIGFLSLILVFGIPLFFVVAQVRVTDEVNRLSSFKYNIRFEGMNIKAVTISADEEFVGCLRTDKGLLICGTYMVSVLR